MILQKNNQLISNICAIYLKSVHGNAFPELTEVHSALSKAKWTSNSSNTDSGVLYKNKIDITYNGLEAETFSNIHTVLHGLHEVIIKTSYGDHFRVGKSECPMMVKNSFSKDQSRLKIENEDFEPIEFISQEAAAGFGFAYVLTFSLS